MKIELPYCARISIVTYNNTTYIEIEDSFNKLKKKLLNSIFADDGIDTLKDCINEDMLSELLNFNNKYLINKDSKI